MTENQLYRVQSSHYTYEIARLAALILAAPDHSVAGRKIQGYNSGEHVAKAVEVALEIMLEADHCVKE